ncbi:WecB/TagA/CpsF family glycosyltransferase [Cecembia lonarensis]|uniref:Putative N-acetylmannosaminyltransferase n=1 Tax=Cecembia lonarensis (strain CCUG 58316 / KCTC 22772 / LW9) TaxID=1225176 RepID=K1KW21_CECL9|nr:WecB/TagA/CpsF family glycosyltransferase [Cecembia lonarensis]EKB48335.1 Putative N-acetylmannosaminyltransferase [Cecembia lonarensis LW9]
MSNINPIPVNGIRIYPFKNQKELFTIIENKKIILFAINAEKILHSNKQMVDLINKNIGYADGVGARWALEKRGANDVIKIPGCELWLEIVNYFLEEKSFYLIGGTEKVIKETVDKLNLEFPNFKLLGFRNGYFKSDDDKLELINDVLEKKPDIVFVAMGSPKQEILMSELYKVHPAIYQGLGGSFDVYTGNAKRAPKWWIENNLEWAYRLIKQPSRIKRQFHLIRFYFLLKFNKL